MFQKKQIIYSEELGVCRVENITGLAAGREDTPVQYYVLKPLTGSAQSAYLPVEGHKQVLRELFTPEEARRLQQSEAAGQEGPLKAAIAYVLAGEEKPADTEE